MSPSVNAKTYLPGDVIQRTRACKFFGAWCTSVLDYSANSLADEWHLYSQYDNLTYPGPGLYGFEKTFYWPDNSMTDYPWAGFSFNLVTDILATDTGNDYTHMRCHAPFTTVNFDTYQESGNNGSGFSSHLGAWSMVGIVGVAAYAGLLKRKKHILACTPSISLGDIDPQDVGCTNFEMMDAGSVADDSMRDSARV